MKNLYVVILILSISGCTSGTDTQNIVNEEPDQNTGGVQISKAGMWQGDIGYGDTEILVDDNNEVYGYTINDIPYPNRTLYTIVGNLGEVSEFEGMLSFKNHMNVDYYSPENYYAHVRNSFYVEYSLNFVEEQTAQGIVKGYGYPPTKFESPAANITDGLLLTYSTKHNTIPTIPIGRYGSQQKRGFLVDNPYNPDYGYEYLSQTYLDYEITADGQITGTYVNRPLNWNGPDNEELFVSGNIEPVQIGNHHLFKVNLSLSTTTTGAAFREWNGYAWYVSGCCAGMQGLRIVTKNIEDGSVYAFTINKLN